MAGLDAVILSGAAVTVIDNAWVALKDVGVLESVAFTLKPKVPGAVGVPLISPDELSFSPDGREPKATDQVYGPMPPVAPKDWS